MARRRKPIEISKMFVDETLILQIFCAKHFFMWQAMSDEIEFPDKLRN